MPRLTATEIAPPATTVEFIVSVPLDLMNAMYFTRLAADHEGLEGWPTETRKAMPADLLEEFDFLYNFPLGEPGVLGTMGDMLWAQPQTWDSIEALLAYVRNLPLGIGSFEEGLGVQGLCYNVTACDIKGNWPETRDLRREALVARLQEDAADVDAVIAIYDRPEELRTRMVNLIERVYREYYKPDLPRRLACLQASAAAHQGTTADHVADVMKQISGRDNMCLEPDGVCYKPWRKLRFAPSMDMGPYMSCAVIGSLHGMFYPCESKFITGNAEGDDSLRMARIYKALSDEQRLRILDILREREMYAQEIVDRTGLHQSMVSRHLGFLKAVGLLHVRKVSNMKFFSLNPDIRRQLARTLEMFPETATAEGGRR